MSAHCPLEPSRLILEIDCLLWGRQRREWEGRGTKGEGKRRRGERREEEKGEEAEGKEVALSCSSAPRGASFQIPRARIRCLLCHFTSYICVH